MKRMFAANLTAMFVIAGCATGQGIATQAVAPPSPASVPTASAVATPTASQPTPAPTSTPTPTPADTPPLMPVGDLEAGATYAIDNEAPGRMTFTVPGDGWFSIDTWFLGKDVLGDEGYDLTLLPYFVKNVYADPCQWKGSHLDPAVGPTVADLAAALVAQDGRGAPKAKDATVGGYAGKEVKLTIPDDVDNGTCDEGDYGRWAPAGDPSWYGPFTYGRGQHDTVYIVDVEGTRWVIDTSFLPGNSRKDLAELDRLLKSIRFEP